MATDPFQYYAVVAQIAAAFAGFGSIASGLGHRRGGDDTRVDANRLAMMLVASLSATLLGLLPVTLSALSLGERWSLSGSAFVALAVIIAYSPTATKRAVRIRHVEGFSRAATVANLGCILIAVIGFSLCALGLPADRLAGTYLLGLMGLLGSSIVLFSRVIGSLLRPHKAD
jgi:hypothetical protein